LLAVQNAIADECLACDEGGYRELDLTFVRHRRRRGGGRPTTAATAASKGDENATTAVRWAARDVVWTGGNMMALNASSSHSPSSDADEYGNVKFEPRRLVEGDGAAAIASRYFPAMAKRLRIRNVLSGDGDSSTSSSSSSSVFGGKRSPEDEAYGAPMVIIGDMEVVAPVSFVRMRRGVSRANDDDDGLWE
jgi:hypothetical protein